MRVAIYHNLPDGGAIRALHELVKHSYKQVEYDLYQLSPFDTASRYDFRSYVKKYFSYNYRYHPSRMSMLVEILTRFYSLRQIQKKIAHEIDSNNYDAVFIHHCAITQTPFVLSYLKTKNLYFIQEPRRLSFEYDFYQNSKSMIPSALQLPWALRQNILKKLDISNARKCTAALCNSYYAKTNIAKAYGINAKVCYLGIDQKQFTYKKSLKKDQIVVVGTLHPAKGQDLAIRSLAKVSNTSIELVFVYENYDARYKAELVSLADRLRVRVHFRQGVTDTELVSIYQQSRLTLAIASREPFGFTPIESAACGTPIIAVKEGGYTETVINGKNGLLCKRNEKSIAGAIDEGLRVKWDASSISRDARNQWSWHKSTHTYIKSIEDVIHG